MKQIFNIITILLVVTLLFAACSFSKPAETTAPTSSATTPTTVSTTDVGATSPQPAEEKINGWIYTPASTPEDTASSAVAGLAERAGIESVMLRSVTTCPDVAALYSDEQLKGAIEGKDLAYIKSHMQVLVVSYTVFYDSDVFSKGAEYQCNLPLLPDDNGFWRICGVLAPAPDAVQRLGWYCTPAETAEAAAQGAIESLKDSYAVLDVTVDSVTCDSKLTATNVAALSGGELVKAMGLTDAQLETHFKIILVTYTLSVDTNIQDRRMNSGTYECQFQMVLNPKSGLWSCFSSVTKPAE